MPFVLGFAFSLALSLSHTCFLTHSPPRSNLSLSFYSVFPVELERIRVWLRDYKKPDGYPENKFG